MNTRHVYNSCVKSCICVIMLTVSIGQTFAQSSASLDTLFKEPYLDIDEWRDKPVGHHYVHGGFKGSDTRFSFYFPPKQSYQGRFFQYITPVPDNENLSQGSTGAGDKIGFSIASGAYFVETNGGGQAKAPGSADPRIGAYLANAASANFSRVVAIRKFGGSRPYGYAFGGSGGAYRTVASIENTDGVWDGVVPFVLGSSMALPNVFSVRMHAMRVLQNKFPQIVDALEPGGSGKMYEGLITEEQDALREVTKMGFPPKAWFNYQKMGIHAFPAIYPALSMIDKKYFTDFWTVPGYLGEKPPSSLINGRIQQVSKIKAIIPEDQATKLGLIQGPLPGEAHGSADAAWKAIGQKDGTLPVAFQLDSPMPQIQFLGGDLIIKSGEATGKTLLLTQLMGDKVVLGTNDLKVLAQLKPGDQVQVDNSNFLAAQTYHRHQVPGKDYPVWDQFRDSEGKPIYPQRPMLIGPLLARGATGSLQTGKFKGKMILVESLWDTEAYPWQADWYGSKVKAALGDSADSHFRIWYTDHANHSDFTRPGDPTHIVSYLGVLQQALRDLSAWVEKGVSPPASTNYKIEDGQVIIPATAKQRQGIQPVVTLEANGAERADVAVDKAVTFTASIQLPANTGKIISAKWDFDGSGTFAVDGKFTADDKSGGIVTLKINHSYPKPGTYFVTLKAVSQREGDGKTPYARIENLGRVRVVVK